jgi:hypothetical protein
MAAFAKPRIPGHRQFVSRGPHLLIEIPQRGSLVSC